LVEVLGWSAAEVAGSLELSVAAVNSALQRARATLASRNISEPAPMSKTQEKLVERYVDAFQRYDVDELASLLHEEATFSMPPFELWLRGPEAVRGWLRGRGSICQGSVLVPTAACGSPAFGQYHPTAEGFKPWAVIVLELSGDRISGWNSFLDTELLFPRFGLPPTL
jgi:RNA polymerase sigma-70 factor (ECF subfamily)